MTTLFIPSSATEAVIEALQRPRELPDGWRHAGTYITADQRGTRTTITLQALGTTEVFSAENDRLNHPVTVVPAGTVAASGNDDTSTGDSAPDASAAA